MRAELEALMQQIQDNQRKDWRLELSEPIRGWITGSGGEDVSNDRIQAWIEDLSDRGLGIRTSVPIGGIKDLNLSFRWHGRTLNLKGTVAWEKTNEPESHTGPFRFVYGIRLSSDDPEQIESQKELIRRMIQVISERHKSFETMVSRIRRRTSKNNPI